MAAVVMAGLLTACSSGGTSAESPTASVPSAFADREASGEQLADAFFGLLSMTGGASGGGSADAEAVQAGVDLVRPYLGPSFQILRSTGQRYTADTYVPADIGEFEISEVVTTQPSDDVVVVRYNVATPGAIAPDSNLLFGGDAAPRLTVFRWDDERGHWVLASHANFNSKVAAICDATPFSVDEQEPVADAETVALGETLVQQWKDITTGKVTTSILDPQAQIQLADGQGWPTADGSEIEWTPAQAYEFANVLTTRDGDLLVVSYDAVADSIVMEGAEYRSTTSPRLLTYQLDPEAGWQLISLANFTVPAEIPDGVDCVTPSS